MQKFENVMRQFKLIKNNDKYQQTLVCNIYCDVIFSTQFLDNISK